MLSAISDPATEPPITPQQRHWPADYYSSATADPVLPRGVSYGCGALSVLVLLVVFIGGTMLGRGENLGKLMDFAMGTTLGEMRGMFTPEVTKEQKDALEREVKAMRGQLREKGLPVARVQPFIRALDQAMRDDKVTPKEVEQLTRVAREAVQSRKAAESQRLGEERPATL